MNSLAIAGLLITYSLLVAFLLCVIVSDMIRRQVYREQPTNEPIPPKPRLALIIPCDFQNGSMRRMRNTIKSFPAQHLIGKDSQK